jgi:hypothetical protein
LNGTRFVWSWMAASRSLVSFAMKPDYDMFFLKNSR